MQIGTSVGPYQILRHLGTGGMGAVWLAEDTRLRRHVALKMVRAADIVDDSARERLMREARAAAALNHPHIATVHDVIESDGQVVIVFEYVEGDTLHDRIQRGKLPAAEAVDIAIQIAKALSAAHAHGIVHRDLKPANVIISSGGHVKVLDFGIARILAVGTTETATGQPQSSGVGFIGTPSYAAPEQMVSAAVDERADLYALGVVLFEMISGRRPFPGNDPVQLASSKLSQDAPPLSSTGQLVPPALERFVASLLERERSDRPTSATEALAQLRAIYGTPSTGALAGRRAPGLAVSLVAVAIIAALAGFGAWELNRFARPAVDPSAPPVIAVLPLANVSGDPAKDHVAAGIAESLISSLASLPSVTVLSRASVTEARTRAKDEAALAKDLGATYLVNGSVQEANGTLKISLNLVKPDRTVAWGDSVEGAFERIFEMQSRLATALTSALVVRVSASERERMNAAQPTTSPLALEAYWQGTALLERSDVKGNVEAAILAFDQALQIDPRFALAYAGLGQAFRRKYAETREPSWAERAIDAATNALRLDPDRPEVRYVLALTLAGGGRSSDAVEELNRALAIRPNYEDARRQLGVVLAEQGRVDEAITEFRRAIALRPNAGIGYGTMGFALLSASRYKEAAEAFEQLIKVQPDNFSGYQQLGTAYQFLGQNDKALENYRKALAIRPSAAAFSNMGALLHLQGDFTGAVEAYRQAIAIRPNSATTHRNLGDALSRLSRADEAKRSYLEALRLFDNDLKVNPKDARTMALSSVVARKAGLNSLSAKRFDDALRIAPDHPEVLYRGAALYALNGDPVVALDYLDRAFKRGYSRSWAADDDDLLSLRSHERYKTLMQGDVR